MARQQTPGLLLAALALMANAAAAQTNGNAYFSSPINWSSTGDLYYTVAGGPPNTCGALVTTRNGIPVRANNWLCTDANGGATKGPWTWAGTPGDQTDQDLRIEWPDGTSTVWRDHVWDKTCPTIQRLSAGGSPPTSFSGDAWDGAWGAGFGNGWSNVQIFFEDVAAFKFWTPGLSGYTRVGPWPVTATESGIPGFYLTWSSTAVPPASMHQPGRTYRWHACVADGDDNCMVDENCATYEFTP